MKRSKKLLSLLLAILLCLPVMGGFGTTTQALNEGDFKYEVDGNTATITGYIGSPTNLTIPSTLGGYPVTSIGYRAFDSCRSLTNVVIGNSVTSIGWYAFFSCDSLTSVEIGNGVESIGDYAFFCCTSLTSVVIGNNVTSIGDSAFRSCDSLTSVEIPDSVTSIGDEAFCYCDSLTSVEIGDNVTSIGSGPFTGCDMLTHIAVDSGNPNYKSIDGVLFTKDGTKLIQYPAGKSATTHAIPDNVTSIGDSAFYGCRSLTSVEIGDSVTNIGDYAFSYCSSLTSVAIPDSVTSIGDRAFSYCSSLTSVEIGNSVTSIGGYAFYYCDSLTSVEIGNSVTSIGDYAFSATPWLISQTEEFVIVGDGVFLRYNGSNAEVTIPSTVKYISDAFSGCDSLTSVVIGNSVTSIGDYAFAWCDSLTSVVIGNSVTSIGDWAFYSCDSLTSVVIPDRVTSIGDNTFAWCPSLTSVEIGNSVASIGDYAFEDCTSLTSVVIGNSVASIGARAFASCDSLTSVDIPDSVTSIGDRAFAYCNSLTSVEIGNSVASIGNSAFEECTSLTDISVNSDNSNYKSIDGALFSKDGTTLIQYPIGKTATTYTIPSGVTSIGYGAFHNCGSLTSVEIPDSVTSIGDSAFAYCDSLTDISVNSDNSNYKSIDGVLFTKDGTILIQYPIGRTAATYTIPDSVTSIGNRAFRHCSSLTSVVIGNSVTSIGDYAFYYCRSLTSVEIGNSVASIGDYAFEDCTSLTSVVIPNSVTSIGDYTFYYCTSLTSVVIGNSVTSIGDLAFYSCSSLTSISVDSDNLVYRSIDEVLFTKDGTTLIQYPIGRTATTYTIPDSVTSIGDYAFRGCGSLTSVEIPDSVTSIRNYSFRDCYSLTSVVIGNSVTSIGDYAFRGCGSLTSVEIPDSVTSIGDYTFYYCTSLTSVEIPDSVTSIGDSAFRYCSSLTSVEIPDSVTSIRDYTFYYCTSLTSVEIPDSVTSIGNSAFCNCTSLTIVEIGNSVTSIRDWAFYGCTSLTGISVDSDNSNYKSINGVLFTKDGTTLIQYPIGKTATTYTIPDNVTSIGYYAFRSCGSLTSVEIPDGVTFIGSYAFSECPVTFFCSMESYAAQYAADNDIPVAFTGVMPDELDWANSGYAVNYGEISATGNLSMVAQYCFAEGVDAESISLSFTIPEDAELVTGTLTLNNSPIDDSHINSTEGKVSVALTEKQGVIRFLLKPLRYDMVLSYAKLNFTVADEQKSFMLGFVNMELPVLTLEAQDIVGKSELAVSGISIPGNTVRLYIDGVEQPQTVANHAGDYYATLQLPDPSDGKTYTIKASTIDSNNNTITSRLTVTYQSQVPNIEAFDMSFNGRTYKLYELGSNKPIVTFISGVRFGFTAKFDKTDSISAVKVTSNRRGEVKELETTWDETLGAYTVKGFFDKNDHNYVPGELTLVCTYTMGGDSYTLEYSVTIKWAIDPSGYVYDNVSNERIEGVKATLYYKEVEEDEPTLWDATEYSQQNPLYTDADGAYAWDVPEGLWQVKYEHEDYQTAYSDWLPVPPPQTEVNIGMTPIRSVSSIEIETLPNKLTYKQNIDDLNTSGGMIKVSYSDASTKSIPLTEEMIEGFDNSQLGAKTLTVCYMGKTAEYTVSIGTEMLFGDANRNGSVDAADAAHILRWLVELITDDEIDLTAANVTGTGTVTAADAACILRKLVGLITQYPIEES